jgi:pimeloyl-ACP methyl ester carboxylesterase
MECKLENITVFYESVGEGRPIVMLSGWSLSHHLILHDMEPIFQGRTGWKRYYLDLPGTGKTPGMDWITDQDKILEVVLDFIDSVIPGQSFVVAGVSAGAYLARGVVFRKPGWIDGVLLVVPLVVAEDTRRDVPTHITLVHNPELMSGLSPEEAEGFQMAVVQTQDVLDSLRVIFTYQGANNPEFLARIRENPQKYALSFDVDALPTPCKAPTLIVAGRQDASVGYRDAWKILENYPRATFAVLDRAGHMLEAEQAGLFSALVQEWLDRVEEYAKR